MHSFCWTQCQRVKIWVLLRHLTFTLQFRNKRLIFSSLAYCLLPSCSYDYWFPYRRSSFRFLLPRPSAHILRVHHRLLTSSLVTTITLWLVKVERVELKWAFTFSLFWVSEYSMLGSDGESGEKEHMWGNPWNSYPFLNLPNSISTPLLMGEISWALSRITEPKVTLEILVEMADANDFL